MEKEIFDKWNILKQKIESKERFAKFKEREICFVNLGKNIGSEQDGKGNEFERPVVVFKKFNSDIFIALPLTHKIKFGKYYFNFNLNKISRTIILSQIRLISSRRIKRKIGYMSEFDFLLLKNKLKELIF